MGGRLAAWLGTAATAWAIAACGRVGYDPLGSVADTGAGLPGGPALDASWLDGARDAREDGTASPTDAPAPPADGDSADASPVDVGVAPDSPGASAEAGDAGALPTPMTVNLTDPAATVRSGSAQIGTGELDLTTNTRNVSGAAYLPQPYPIAVATSFTVAFSFRIYGFSGPPGDGFAFLWQDDPRGTAAIGAGGGALGYGGVTPSVEVEFDVLQNTYDPAGNDVAITTDGQYMTALANAVPPFSLTDGATHYVWITYDGTTHALSVYVANTSMQPATPLVSATVDLYTTVGGSAYLGFTGACGVSSEVVAIESLTVAYGP